MDSVKCIAALLYPDFMSLDVVGPLQVFASANAERNRQGLGDAYRLQLLSERAGPVNSSSGMRMLADASWADCDPSGLDTLLVPGGSGETAQCDNQALLAWLRSAEPHIRRLGSVCSGALILARSGLLDGQRVTTHWADMDSLRQHEAVRVDANCLHTYDPDERSGAAHLFTSAGVTAGIDLALALVEADLGRSMALAVARRLVMFLRRPGGQAQFSALLAPEPSHTPRLAELLAWIPGNLGGDLSLEALAERARLTPRTLSRVFARELGTGPARYVERVRLEAARALLQDAQASIATVSRLTGFGHPENLRRVFHKHLAVSPQEYAERFGRETPHA
ncbi:GlxA family transcriptional regulator [Phytopseudomonas dryadis]|uniref:AraC family transcriptional regulator n=1 Tax=Phytopseudomonas dryadis TaxID=2487520 RepID=A0A4Q9R9R4_9GAMM|nr:GlxA family transcriptional regulator [Pseudomonas dryadis]TBU97421.1 AraC family transcriptional regulator [Pseudomonas dryadis]